MPRRQRKKDRRSDEEFTDFKDDSSLINYLTKQYIDNELAVDKSKNHWEVFSQHLKPLIHCLKRYEDASLSQRETSQKSRRQLCWKPYSRVKNSRSTAATAQSLEEMTMLTA